MRNSTVVSGYLVTIIVASVLFFGLALYAVVSEYTSEERRIYNEEYARFGERIERAYSDGLCEEAENRDLHLFWLPWGGVRITVKDGSITISEGSIPPLFYQRTNEPWAGVYFGSIRIGSYEIFVDKSNGFFQDPSLHICTIPSS